VGSYSAVTGTINLALTHVGSGGNSAPVIIGGPIALPGQVVVP
jgi:hypothetical protein